MEESQVTLAVWRAESAAKGRVYGAIGYTEAKRFEGREDPHLVRKYMEKGVTIQEVVSAVRSLVTSAREGRTVETRLDEIVRQWHEKRYPWDTMPWENRLPFSKQHPMAGFVLVVLQEEKKKRRSEERGRLTRRERELVGRKRELEREREEVTAKWEEAILEEGRRLEAYEEAKGRREDIERKLEEGGLSSEERERLEKELAVAKEEEKRAREAYGEAKRVREEIERRKKEIEEEIGRVEEALKLVEERLGELAPEDVREALEMEQEGEDIEGRGSKKEDTPSKSSSSSEKSSVSGSSTSSSSSSEKKGILSSIAEGVSKAVNAVGNAIAGAVNSVVDTASKIAAYVGQEASKVVEGLTGGKKEGDTAKPKPPKRHVNSDVYNRAWEIARKEWAKEGGKKPISDYGQKAVNQADYERKMEKARRLYEEAKASDPNFSHGLDYFKDEVRWETAIEDRLDRAMAGIERGDEEAMKRFQEVVERTMKEMEGFDELQRRVGRIAGEVLKREEGRREARERMMKEKEASKPGGVSSEPKVYTVEKGDTLVKIAQKTGIPLKKLLEMNPHLRGKENYIEIGEEIKLEESQSFHEKKEMTPQKSDGEIMDANVLRENTKAYILGLKEKGLSEEIVNQYLQRLEGLSDKELLENQKKFKFTDMNQRNNLTNVDDKSLGYRTGDVMCFPTSVAIALSNLKIENPVAALGIQFEDHLDNLIRNDPEIMEIAKKYPDKKPRTVGPVEEKMINKYFGDRVVAKWVYKEPWFSDMEEANRHFKKLSESNLNNGAQVIIGTKLTHGGHVVVFSGYDEGGISIIDPYGISSFTKRSNGSSHYDKNSTEAEAMTKGYNVYVNWDRVNEFQLGYRWYMTIRLR
jgi:tetratricopeptide (TPR) repeat protein